MARNSRFNKILNFIGLVDEQEDPNRSREPIRPQGSQTYTPSTRQQGQLPNQPRPVRPSAYDDYRSAPPRYDDRYQPDYDRSNVRDYQPTQRSAPRQDYDRISARPDYQSGSANRMPEAPRNPSPYRDMPNRNNDPYTKQTPAPNVDRPQRDNVVGLFSEGRAQTVIYYLHALEECRDVINDLLDNKTVLLNLEDMDERLIQRGIDTLCGAAFALNATLRKASDKTYLIAPNTVNVASVTEQY